MSKYKYSETEKQINNVLNYQSKELNKIKSEDNVFIDSRISESEALLQKLGIEVEKKNLDCNLSLEVFMPSWEQLCTDAKSKGGSENNLEQLFTKVELQENEEAIKRLNNEFDILHKLDKHDVTICVVAGLIGAMVDILLVGIPQKGTNGIKAGTLSNYIRDYFDKKFPEDQMQVLANSKISKVPFDAQDNRNTKIYVDGLSSYYHRLLQLGHDPILGFVFGVIDILTGRMTTIDKNGKVVSQIMENYSERKESDIFAALSKQIIHFKSDITTSMGLPAPLMSLFDLLQIGSIGEYEQTVAEIVQGMYFEGYDFIHFCSMSIPTMLVEVIVRILYSLKRIREGASIKESIPFSNSRDKNPRLATMLFMGHATATAANAGKVAFTKNPLSINYPQWIAFTKYSYFQLKWAIKEKSSIRNKYVLDKIDEDMELIIREINEDYAKCNVIVME